MLYNVRMLQMLEGIFGLIRDNAGWLFGGSSVCALVIALIERSTNKKKQTGESSKTKSPLYISAIAILILIAATSGGLYISNISLTSTSTKLENGNSGNVSTAGPGNSNLTGNDNSGNTSNVINSSGDDATNTINTGDEIQ